MRSLKAILTTAGHLKRNNSQAEDILSLIVLREVNLPKFTQNDIPLFESITTDLFPGIKLEDKKYTDLTENLLQILKDEFKEPK